jgi:hypothetical protein
MNIAGEDRLRAPDGHHDKVGVDHIAGARASEQTANFRSVIKGDHDDGLQKAGQACLSSALAPHLGHDRMRRRQRCPVSQCCSQKLLGIAFASIDRDEEPGVKNQGRIGCSWRRQHPRRPYPPPVPNR